jgi:dihydroorotase
MIYDGVLVKLQPEQSMIHLLKGYLLKLIIELLSRSVNPSAMLMTNLKDALFDLKAN